MELLVLLPPDVYKRQVVDVEDKTPWQEACKDIIESSTKDNAELYQKILDMAK